MKLLHGFLGVRPRVGPVLALNASVLATSVPYLSTLIKASKRNQKGRNGLKGSSKGGGSNAGRKKILHVVSRTQNLDLSICEMKQGGWEGRMGAWKGEG